MCQKHSVIKECENSWEFELQTSSQISQEISGENGQNDFVIEPLGPEYANFINENWKFKNDTSLEFISRYYTSKMSNFKNQIFSRNFILLVNAKMAWPMEFCPLLQIRRNQFPGFWLISK